MAYLIWFQRWIIGVYLLNCGPHRFSCTPPQCRSGFCCHRSLRTRTGHKRWPACHSTSGCYTPDTLPGPAAGRIEGLRDGRRRKEIKSDNKEAQKLPSTFDGANPGLHRSGFYNHTRAASKIIGPPASPGHDPICEPVNRIWCHTHAATPECVDPTPPACLLTLITFISSNRENL